MSAEDPETGSFFLMLRGAGHPSSCANIFLMGGLIFVWVPHVSQRRHYRLAHEASSLRIFDVVRHGVALRRAIRAGRCRGRESLSIFFDKIFQAVKGRQSKKVLGQPDWFDKAAPAACLNFF